MLENQRESFVEDLYSYTKTHSSKMEEGGGPDPQGLTTSYRFRGGPSSPGWFTFREDLPRALQTSFA